MATINPLIFRLPPGIKDKYDLPVYQGIFDNDGISDRLVFPVLPEDYNAANPVNKEVLQGMTAPVATITRNYYQLEATNKDQRSVFRYVLRDLLLYGGNLSVYGSTTSTTVTCNETDISSSWGFPRSLVLPLVAVEDYHELDEYEDELQGYTLRVGVLNVESLKGSYREKGANRNYNRGCRVIFTHTHKIVDGQLAVYVPSV